MNKKVLHTLIDLHAQSIGHRPAVEGQGRSIDYRSLSEYSNRIAHSLVGEGVKRDAPVGIYLRTGADYVAGILGINKAGGAFMPLETRYPVKRLQYLLDKVAPRVIVTNAAAREQLLANIAGTTFAAQLECIVVLTDDRSPIRIEHYVTGVLNTAREEQFENTPVDVEVSGNDSNYLLYTSGSTGNPKVIEGCHKGLSHFIHWEVSEFGLTPESRVSQLVPLSFDVSLRDIFAPLLAGGTLCVPEDGVKSDPRKLVDWIIESRVALIHTVPSLFRVIIKEIENDRTLLERLRFLKHILLSGEALYGKDVIAWRALAGESVELVNLYGPTETTLAKMFNRIGEAPSDPNAIIPLGVPLPNTSVIVCNDGVQCKIGAIGEILIKTPFRSKGYYNDAVMTAEKFVPNPLHNDYDDIVYRTGDVGQYLADGRIAFVGRMDSQVKIRGNRVELSEIESVIRGIDGVDQAVVIAIKKLDGSDVLASYFTTTANIDGEFIRTYLKDYLPEYMHPSFYILLEEFPLNLNGKVDRKALLRPEELLYEKVSFEAPANALEEGLAIIWSEILGLKKVGVNNSFFSLGGHSLTATRAVSRIYKDLGIKISLKDFFDYSSIRKISEFLGSKPVNEFQAIEPLPVQTNYPLSRAQKMLWVLDQTASGDMVAYNMQGNYIIKGDIDSVAFEKAFSTLIERHESLRTTIVVAQGEPMQKINPTIPFKIERSDAAVDGRSEKAIVAALAEAEFQRPFDLATGPLLRVKLIKLSGQRHLFLFTMHHIISDGWSLGIVMREALELYHAYAAGSETPLRPLRIHYKDYATWHNQLLSSATMEQHRQYWHQKLSGDLPVINLPIDRTREPVRNYGGDKIRFRLSGDQSRNIRELCAQENVTLFMFFLAALDVVLCGETGQRDIMVGTAIGNRNDPDLENQIGIFLNSVALRNQLDRRDTFATFLQHARRTVLEAYEHQSYPIDLLVEELNAKTDDNRNPLYDVLIVFNNDGLLGSREQLNKVANVLDVEAVDTSEGISKFDLSFFINDDEEIGLAFEYSTALFDATTIQRLKKEVADLINAVINDKNQTLDDLLWSLTSHNRSARASARLEVLSENF
ncbi:non-ribosomal peptide synthetase [Chryseolinea lacunae]|uniref:Amino acid adenylation domain-containing protein n=1 Tax=Chryseolinea lacunae TaxID=2801331 RepID=A0ABS1KUD3_9BACT|nr:non-ribosomal peptide synthetase [Chryseolinea lacunae]MBL0743084.1 amino acid adenylation domain-containing protein [Chryseolinea lacunae]